MAACVDVLCCDRRVHVELTEAAFDSYEAFLVDVHIATALDCRFVPFDIPTDQRRFGLDDLVADRVEAEPQRHLAQDFGSCCEFHLKLLTEIDQLNKSGKEVKDKVEREKLCEERLWQTGTYVIPFGRIPETLTEESLFNFSLKIPKEWTLYLQEAEPLSDDETPGNARTDFLGHFVLWSRPRNKVAKAWLEERERKGVEIAEMEKGSETEKTEQRDKAEPVVTLEKKADLSPAICATKQATETQIQAQTLTQRLVQKLAPTPPVSVLHLTVMGCSLLFFLWLRKR